MSNTPIDGDDDFEVKPRMRQPYAAEAKSTCCLATVHLVKSNNDIYEPWCPACKQFCGVVQARIHLSDGDYRFLDEDPEEKWQDGE